MILTERDANVMNGFDGETCLYVYFYENPDGLFPIIASTEYGIDGKWQGYKLHCFVASVDENKIIDNKIYVTWSIDDLDVHCFNNSDDANDDLEDSGFDEMAVLKIDSCIAQAMYDGETNSEFYSFGFLSEDGDEDCLYEILDELDEIGLTDVEGRFTCNSSTGDRDDASFDVDYNCFEEHGSMMIGIVNEVSPSLFIDDDIAENIPDMLDENGGGFFNYDSYNIEYKIQIHYSYSTEGGSAKSIYFFGTDLDEANDIFKEIANICYDKFYDEDKTEDDFAEFLSSISFKDKSIKEKVIEAAKNYYANEL